MTGKNFIVCKKIYRLVPLRTLRNTAKVKFHEIVPSDIPKIHGVDRVIHEAYATSPEPVEDCANPSDAKKSVLPKNGNHGMCIIFPEILVGTLAISINIGRDCCSHWTNWCKSKIHSNGT